MHRATVDSSLQVTSSDSAPLRILHRSPTRPSARPCCPPHAINRFRSPPRIMRYHMDTLLSVYTRHGLQVTAVHAAAIPREAMALVAHPSASPCESLESRASRAQKLLTDRPGALSLGPADISRPEPQEVGHRAHHLCGHLWRAHPLLAALASLRRAAVDPRAQAARRECPSCVATCVDRQCHGSGADVHASCPTGTGGCCRPQEWCLQGAMAAPAPWPSWSARQIPQQ